MENEIKEEFITQPTPESIDRLWRCELKTNEGSLVLYVKTSDVAINKAKEEAKKTAEQICISNLLFDKGFSYAYLDKIALQYEEIK